jgi:DNA-binding MarR family transcriptional regulator
MDRASYVETDMQVARELDALVRYVTEPRRLSSIMVQAVRVGQPVRSQLVRLVACGRLTQPRHGVFAPAGFIGSIVMPDVSLEGAALAARLVALVDRPTLLRNVAAQLGEAARVLPWVVMLLVSQGKLCQPERGVLAPAGHDPSKPLGNDLVALGEIHALLETPCRTVAVAAALGLTRPAAERYLAGLEQAGTVVRVRSGLYGLPGVKTRGNLPSTTTIAPSRPQPIRDAILAYLTEPRRALEIAVHIERSIATATGHLAAMKRRGLVVSVKHGVYARPDRCELGEKKVGEQASLEIAA